MVAEDDVGAGVNGGPPEGLLAGGGTVRTLRAPVEGGNDDFRAIGPQLGDVGLDAVVIELKSGGVQADFQAAFGGDQGGLFVL